MQWLWAKSKFHAVITFVALLMYLRSNISNITSLQAMELQVCYKKEQAPTQAGPSEDWSFSSNNV